MVDGFDIPGFPGIDLSGGAPRRPPQHQQPSRHYHREAGSDGLRNQTSGLRAHSHQEEEGQHYQQEGTERQHRHDSQAHLQNQHQADLDHFRRLQQRQHGLPPPPVLNQGLGRLPGLRELNQAPGDDQLKEAESMIEELRKRIQELEQASRERHVGRSLVASNEEIERARIEARLTGQSMARVVTLPPINPGFKADPFELPIPPKVNEAFRKFHYVPYTSLTRQSRDRALREDDELVATTSGTFRVKGLDRKDESAISFTDWLAASKTAVERMRHYHGEARGRALEQHHRIVEDLARTYTHAVAMEYDIRQREAVARHPGHDLSTCDFASLNIITSQMFLSMSKLLSAPSPYDLAPSSPSKRKAFDTFSERPEKKPRLFSCFRCGDFGHLPAGCTSDYTVAGLPALALAGSLRNTHALQSSDGERQCCPSWAQSSCTYGTTCKFSHECSICRSTSHGALECPAISEDD